MSVVQRARPWLGTLVEMRVAGVDERSAVRAIESAFAEVAAVHRLMSFHEPGSDLSRLHRADAGKRVPLDARTHAVLACALRIAAASRGCFDPTVAAEQVAWGLLPRPDSAYAPDPHASWSDIELLDGAVRLRRPLWIDLGGIAKGYAVDRALEILRASGASQACVNAGGDLRVAGPCAERVHLRGGGRAQHPIAGLEITDAAVASSAGINSRRRVHGHWRGAHVHGNRRGPIGTLSSVSVIADRCMIADALTKIVLAQGQASCDLLAAFGARACMHDPWRGWRSVGEAA
jgi:thiamine biosynthesis lipoprotein